MSIDLPTADGPAGNLDIEEAGLWLRFFVLAEISRKKKPAGLADGLRLFAWRGLVELVLRANADGLEGRSLFKEAARTEVCLLVLRIAIFEPDGDIAGHGRFQTATHGEAACASIEDISARRSRELEMLPAVAADYVGEG